MVKKVLLNIGAFILACVGVAAYISSTSDTGSIVKVSNSSGKPVQVIAMWRQHNRDLGAIGPGEEAQFEVRDEAEMSFTVRYSSGKVVTSTEVYFTPGLSIVAKVSKNSIEVNYEPGT